MAPGEALRRARLAAGMTQAELGRLAGLTDGQVSRLESGARDGTLDTWRRICAAVGLDPAAVLAPLPEDSETECTPPEGA